MSASDSIHVQASSRHGNVYDARMQAMEAGSTNARIDALGEKIDDLSRSIDRRFEQVDKRFEQIDKRLEKLESRMDYMQWTLFTAAVAVVVALIGFN